MHRNTHYHTHYHTPHTILTLRIERTSAHIPEEPGWTWCSPCPPSSCLLISIYRIHQIRTPSNWQQCIHTLSRQNNIPRHTSLYILVWRAVWHIHAYIYTHSHTRHIILHIHIQDTAQTLPHFECDVLLLAVLELLPDDIEHVASIALDQIAIEPCTYTYTIQIHVSMILITIRWSYP